MEGFHECELTPARWITGILVKGYRAPLELDDLPPVPSEHDVGSVSHVFEEAWDEVVAETSEEDLQYYHNGGEGQATIWKVLFRLIKWRTVFMCCLFAVSKALEMFIAYLLIQLVDYLYTDSPDVWSGLALVFSMFACSALSSVAWTQAGAMGTLIRMDVRYFPVDHSQL